MVSLKKATFLSIVLLAAVATSASTVRGEDVVVGMSAAFAGPSQGLGIELYRGSMAYLEHANQNGLIPGRRIVIKAYDDGYQPDPAVRNTIRLIEEDKVFLLFDYVGTPTVARVLPLLLHNRYRRENTFLFFPFTGAELQRRPPYSEFVFNLRASYSEETRGLVEHFLALNRKRIAVLYQSDAYGRSGWDGVRRTLEVHGLRMVAEATYRRGDPFEQSFREQVEILRQADPDAVICIGAYAAGAGFIRDARDAGWNAPIANVSFADSDNTLALLLEAEGVNGRNYTGNLIMSQVVPSHAETRLPAVAEYRKLMDRYDPKAPPHLADPDYHPRPYSHVGLEGFLNAKVLVRIIQLMGSDVRREMLPKMVESLEHLDLGLGLPLSFGPDRHQGLHEVYYTTVVDGRPAPVTDWSPWKK